MGNVSVMTPKDGLSAKAFLLKFIEDYGDELFGVIVLGLSKDEDNIIDGWSKEVHEKSTIYLGAIEQLKLDFWNTLFTKRLDVINNK